MKYMIFLLNKYKYILAFIILLRLTLNTSTFILSLNRQTTIFINAPKLHTHFIKCDFFVSNFMD